MAGHSKWANIKHRKGKADAMRGKVFSKMAKEIMSVASTGGGNPSENIALRTLIQKAKDVSMPKENIERAIKKGTGELEGGRLEEGSYEGYAAGGAVVVKVLTDNKNRSASEVRHAFSKAGASLAEQGSVSRLFRRKGKILIEKSLTDEETLMNIAVETVAEDLKTVGNYFEIITAPADFDVVYNAVAQFGIEMAEAAVTMIPNIVIKLTETGPARLIMKLMKNLDELEDVHDVYTNFEIPGEIAARIEVE